MKWTGQGGDKKKDMDALVSTQGGSLYGVGASMGLQNPQQTQEGALIWILPLQVKILAEGS